MLLVSLALALSLDPASIHGFWSHWGDGRAELNGYRIVQPRYGTDRPGRGVLVFVTEDMSDRQRVKAEAGRHPVSDIYPVLKLNAVGDFQTGIYDYNVMTSTFCRVAPGWPVAKVSLSSQEWCGHVYHQLLPRQGRIDGVFHSYFDGEADGTEELPLPPGGVFEDALLVLLRGWLGDYLAPGQSRTVPFLPSLLRARLEHRPLAWGSARIDRSASTSTVTVPAGRFEVWTWTVAVDGGPTTTIDIEGAPPFRVVRRVSSEGERAELLGSARLSYWKLSRPGDETHLRELGLKVP